jgi:hypothetical protein
VVISDWRKVDIAYDPPVAQHRKPDIRSLAGIRDAARSFQMKFDLGRRVLGLAAIFLGVVTFVWHDFNIWQQIQPLGNLSHPAIVVYLAAIVQTFGGLALQSRRTAPGGAIALGVVYLMFALLWLPVFIANPRVYGNLGSFFEQFSLVCGALIVYAASGFGNREQSTKLARLGYFGFGICVISFMLEQLLNLRATADFVPKWIPPGQMFWSVVTTIAFALGAIALLSGPKALLAARLITAMILGFGLFVWLPAPFADRHDVNNWAGNGVNLAIAGAAWVVADFLYKRSSATSA